MDIEKNDAVGCWSYLHLSNCLIVVDVNRTVSFGYTTRSSTIIRNVMLLLALNKSCLFDYMKMIETRIKLKN